MINIILTIIFVWLGYYRFVKGKFLAGFIYLFTYGLFGIGWIIDIVLVIKEYVNKRSHNRVIGSRKSSYNTAGKLSSTGNHTYIDENGSIIRADASKPSDFGFVSVDKNKVSSADSVKTTKNTIESEEDTFTKY